MIPRRIHYCWYGRGPMSALHQKCLASWAKHLPDYELQCWDEDNTEFDNAFLREAFAQQRWAFVSDYIRMRAVYEHGGIYLDCDVEIVRDFEPLLGLECFLGEEAKERPNTAVLGAEAGHGFPKVCMELIERRHAERSGYLIAPELALLALSRGESATGVTIFEPVVFYPYNPYDSQRKGLGLMFSDVTERTFAIHHWAKGWKMSRREKMRKSLNKLLQRLGLRPTRQ